MRTMVRVRRNSRESVCDVQWIYAVACDEKEAPCPSTFNVLGKKVLDAEKEL